MCMSIFYHKIFELNGDAILKEKSLSTIKKLTEILVIDDKEFGFLDALRKHEFSIQQKYDLINSTKRYGMALYWIFATSTVISRRKSNRRIKLIRGLKSKPKG